MVRPGFQTDPQGHWLDGHDKTFSVPGRKYKEPMRLEAIAWAAARYKIEGEWERDPWGDYHPAGALQAAQESAASAASAMPEDSTATT